MLSMRIKTHLVAILGILAADYTFPNNNSYITSLDPLAPIPFHFGTIQSYSTTLDPEKYADANRGHEPLKRSRHSDDHARDDLQHDESVLEVYPVYQEPFLP